MALSKSITRLLCAALILPAISLCAYSAGKSHDVSLSAALKDAIKKSSLNDSGTPPFHLKAIAAPAYSYSPNLTADIEEYWVSPKKWKRTIHTPDFDQTVTVNGGKRFESDSSPYFPEWLNQIVTALFDVAPPHTVNEIDGLNKRMTETNGIARGITYHPFSTDGKVISEWTGQIAFDGNSGALTWISGVDYAADFSKFKSFHMKLIPRLIETFPPVPRGDVKTKITELSDLKHPDNSMFAVPDPTPADQQIRTVYVPEAEYRQFAASQPAMNWAPLKDRPTSGTLSTKIVTDRTGRIRECEFTISDNMNIAGDAVQLVKQWQFKPYLVDGVPVQVESTMTFRFDTAITGSQAGYQAASYYFKRARDLTYPRTDGSQPFHLVGTFEGAGNLTWFKGLYEETWLAPDRWRREISVQGLPTVIETRMGDDHYRQLPPRELSKLVDRVLSLFTADFPGFAYYSPDTDWTMADVQFDDKPVLLTGMGCEGEGASMRCSRSIFFDPDGKLVERSQSGESILYGNFAAFSGKQVPREITLRMNGVLALTARVDRLDGASPLPDSSFILDGVRPDHSSGYGPW